MMATPRVPKEDVTPLHNELKKTEKKLVHSRDVQAGEIVRSAGPVCFHDVTCFSNPVQYLGCQGMGPDSRRVGEEIMDRVWLKV